MRSTALESATPLFDNPLSTVRATDATYASGARWEQGFDLAGRVIATIDPLGATVTHSYDPAGRKIRESGPRAGQFVAYTLDAAGNRIGVSDAAGRALVNTYDALNRLDTSTDADGLVERLGYDADGRVTSRENGRGEITGFDFNALGHEIGRTLPPNQAGARALVFTPGIHGELLAETDANRHITTHSYDSLGRRISSQLPAVPDGGTPRSWRFDRVGNVLGHTDAAGRETTWTYSALNHRESQTDPSPPGTTQAWTYDVAGNVLSHTDRRGIVHTQRYDGENRVIERTRDGLRIETLAYDLAGRVLSRTDARNEETRYTYDAGGSPLSETRALGFVQRWTYTPWGGVETQTDADGLTRGHVYDARQRLIEESDPAGKRTTHRYDLADNRTRTTRPGNAEWRYAFDADRKLIEVESPEGHRSVYTHDRHGNRVEQRDAENTRTDFTYDARHRLRAIDHPVGGDESFAYNGEGELTAHTDRAGQAIAIERDGLGRVTERRYGAAETGDVHREVWTLDGDGQPTMLSQYGEPDGPHHVQRRFDGQGRLTQEDDRYSQRSRWTYDEAGNRLSLIDPAGTTTTAPDRLNRIARLSTDAGSTALSYSPAGRLQQITHPNGAVSDYTYDDAGRVERITHRQGNTEVARFEYTHDDRGNRREERRIDASGEQITSYDYDRDDRLTQVEVEDPQGIQTTTTYTLDAVGNREREEVRRGSTTVSDTRYTYQAHQRLTQTQDSVSGITTEYTYDDRGHLTSETTAGQTTTYRPNAQDRLATLTLPGAPPVHYSYDAAGKRVERRTNTDLTRFGWDGPTLRRETNAANNVLEAHDWAAGRILASRSLTDTRYAQHDALRSPIRWSRSTGAEAGQLRYDAWGDTTASATDLPRIAYTGHYREHEGSAYYAQQRYYRPGLGRFNRVDPWEGDVLNPITLNKYLYANGNPLAYIDPDGRMGWPNSLEEMPGYERLPVNELHYTGGSPEARQAALDNMSPEQMAQYYRVQATGTVLAASLAPGALLARGVYGLGAATFSAYRAGGAYHAANVAVVEGAALTESAILTGVGVTTGAEVPSVMSSPVTASRRLMQTAGGLDASLDALQPLQRVASQAALPMPRASLLSSSAAANRVQRAQPVTVVEGAGGGSAVVANSGLRSGVTVEGGSIVSNARGTVFSGHGGYEIGSGTAVVPEGTSLTFYSKFGSTITNRLGNVVETGGDLSKVYSRTYQAGERLPDYTLHAPDGLTLSGNPFTVSSPTRVSELLQPGMGNCHWAACTYNWRAAGANTVYDTVGIGDKKEMQWITVY